MTTATQEVSIPALKSYQVLSDQVARLETDHKHLVYKEDLSDLRGEINVEMERLRTELHKGLNRNLAIILPAITATIIATAGVIAAYLK